MAGKVSLFISILSLLGVVVIGVLQFKSGSNLGYVDLQELYNDFEFKKQLERKLEKEAAGQLAEIDSLKMFIERAKLDGLTSDKTSMNRLYEMQKVLDEKEMAYEANKEELLENANTQIISQLNQYLKEFGDKRGLMIVIGGKGDGGVMYANEAINYTKEAKEFVNQRFLGKK